MFLLFFIFPLDYPLVKFIMMFNEQKATQMAIYFLRQQNGTMNKLKLIKLLYLAERESLKRYGRPMTYDRLVSMDHGPVLSKTLDLANRVALEAQPNGWYDRIDWSGHYDLTLTSDNHLDCLDELSQTDHEVLKDVWQQFGHMDQWQVRDRTHDFQEWKGQHGTAVSINYKEIFLALDYSDQEADARCTEIETEERIDQVFRAL